MEFMLKLIFQIREEQVSQQYLLNLKNILSFEIQSIFLKK